jgi:hypothetical protein
LKTLLNPWFVIGCIVGVTMFILRRMPVAIPHYFNNYLTDLFAIPVIANTGLWFMRVAIVKNNHYKLSPGQVIFIVLYVSLIFEVVLPHFSERYTGDLMDVLMYVLGGVFFQFTMNKSIIAAKR